MAVGLRVIGDSGNTLISDLYPNLCLREKGTVRPGGGTAAAVFNRSGLNCPVLFLGGSVPTCGYACKTASGTSAFLVFTGMGVSTTDVPYYIFDTPDPTAPHGGLRVCDAAGVVMFDSARKQLLVDSFTQVNPGDSATVTRQAGRTYAVAHVQFGLREQAGIGFFQLIGANGGVGSWGYQMININTNSPNVGTNLRAAQFLVADVTGI